MDSRMARTLMWRSALAVLAVLFLAVGCAAPLDSVPVGTAVPTAAPAAAPPQRPSAVPTTVEPPVAATPRAAATASPVGQASPTAQPAVVPAASAVATGAVAATQVPSRPNPTLTPLPSPLVPTSAPTPAPAATPQPALTRATAAFWTDRVAEAASGQLTSAAFSPQQGVRLAGKEEALASTGEYLSVVRETASAFDNAVLSWNADAPAGTYVGFDLRVRDSSGWSGWYAMGEWGPEGGRSVGGQSDARGKVDIDTLKLSRPAAALQYRVRLSTTSPAASPLVRQVSVTYADMRSGLSGPPLARVPEAARDLNVPQHSQLEEDPSYRSAICSATSLAMLMQYWGLDRTVAQVVAGVKDRATGIYGNWTLNMAYAGANGFDARVERFYSVVQLEQEVAAGKPVAISIAYNPGELSGSPIRSTDGHLIVVRGFTSEGNVIVNDPIAPNSKSTKMVYNREELSRIWLRSGGVAYVISPRAGGPLSR